VTSADYPSAAARSRVTPPALEGEITEMDALVAYLQKIGRDLKEFGRKETAAR
jgi:cytochrome c oxidase cbb3-type subunit 2